MPIVIKELFASDPLSEALEKINFNFDQLILSGGGPPGPIGPQGVPGPVGPQGDRGDNWFVNANQPTTNHDGGPLQAKDHWIDSDNGNLFEYNGTSWVSTGVNLKGPTGDVGPAGSSFEMQFYQGATGNIQSSAGYYPKIGPTTVDNTNVNFVTVKDSYKNNLFIGDIWWAQNRLARLGIFNPQDNTTAAAPFQTTVPKLALIQRAIDINGFGGIAIGAYGLTAGTGNITTLSTFQGGSTASIVDYRDMAMLGIAIRNDNNTLSHVFRARTNTIDFEIQAGDSNNTVNNFKYPSIRLRSVRLQYVSLTNDIIFDAFHDTRGIYIKERLAIAQLPSFSLDPASPGSNGYDAGSRFDVNGGGRFRGILDVGDKTANEAVIRIGGISRSADGPSTLIFNAQSTSPINFYIKRNAGANGLAEIVQTGSGDLNITKSNGIGNLLIQSGVDGDGSSGLIRIKGNRAEFKISHANEGGDFTWYSNPPSWAGTGYRSRLKLNPLGVLSIGHPEGADSIATGIWQYGGLQINEDAGGNIKGSLSITQTQHYSEINNNIYYGGAQSNNTTPGRPGTTPTNQQTFRSKVGGFGSLIRLGGGPYPNIGPSNFNGLGRFEFWTSNSVASNNAYQFNPGDIIINGLANPFTISENNRIGIDQTINPRSSIDIRNQSVTIDDGNLNFHTFFNGGNWQTSTYQPTTPRWATNITTSPWFGGSATDSGFSINQSVTAGEGWRPLALGARYTGDVQNIGLVNRFFIDRNGRIRIGTNNTIDGSRLTITNTDTNASASAPSAGLFIEQANLSLSSDASSNYQQQTSIGFALNNKAGITRFNKAAILFNNVRRRNSIPGIGLGTLWDQQDYGRGDLHIALSNQGQDQLQVIDNSPDGDPIFGNPTPIANERVTINDSRMGFFDEGEIAIGNGNDREANTITISRPIANSNLSTLKIKNMELRTTRSHTGTDEIFLSSWAYLPATPTDLRNLFRVYGRINVGNSSNTSGGISMGSSSNISYPSPFIRIAQSNLASLPQYSWNESQNTGFYLPAVNNIGVSTGGTERMRISNEGISMTTFETYYAVTIVAGVTSGYIQPVNSDAQAVHNPSRSAGTYAGYMWNSGVTSFDRIMYIRADSGSYQWPLTADYLTGNSQNIYYLFNLYPTPSSLSNYSTMYEIQERGLSDFVYNTAALTSNQEGYNFNKLRVTEAYKMNHNFIIPAGYELRIVYIISTNHGTNATPSKKFVIHTLKFGK